MFGGPGHAIEGVVAALRSVNTKPRTRWGFSASVSKLILLHHVLPCVFDNTKFIQQIFDNDDSTLPSLGKKSPLFLTSSIPSLILITVKKVLKELIRRRSNESGTATLPEFMHPL